MTGIVSESNSERNYIFGYGISLPEEFPITPNLILSPTQPDFTLEELASGTDSFADYSTCVLVKDLASFALRVQGHEPGKMMSVATWNALWTFSLLTLACETHCISLFTKSGPYFAVSNRNRFIVPRFEVVIATREQLEWASANFSRFDGLIKDEKFSRAMRYLTNAHYLADTDARIMLLWAGIECLLGVESELRHRIGLHAAILFDGTADEKHAYLKKVRGAYDLRSKVVHGRAKAAKDLNEGYVLATDILTRLLRKCIELGRVPQTAELDAAASDGSIT